MADKNDNDPLKDLLLDADEVDRAQLAKALKNYLGIDSKTGRVVLKPGFKTLSTRNRVLTYLLGYKVSTLLGLIDSEEVAPKDIPNETGLPKGTVYPKLKELKEDRLISQSDSSKYYVAPHQILTAIEVLNKEGIKND